MATCTSSEGDITDGLPFMEERRRLIERLREIDKAQAEEVERRIKALEKERSETP